MVQCLYEKLTPGLKDHMRNLGKFRQADGLLSSKEYIPSGKTLYTEDLSNITFNYSCENSPNDLCHF